MNPAYDPDNLFADAIAAGFVPDDEPPQWDEMPDYMPDTLGHENQIISYSPMMRRECDNHGFFTEPLWADVKRIKQKSGFRVSVLDTIPNTNAVLAAMGITARFNMMTRQDDYTGGIADGRQADGVVTRLISAAKSRGYGARDVIPHLAEIAAANSFHPVREWVLGTGWDGISRIAELAKTLHTDIPSTTELFLKRWAIGALQAVMFDKPKPQQGVLVLVGGQGSGKTTWINALCPLEGAVLTGAELDPHKPDSIIKCTGAWITELGEIDGTMRRSDIATLKAFVTQDTDTYRTPYARLPRTYQRRTAFAATVNESDYLKDTTGNRRWWTIPVKQIDRHTIDMQQFWAEVAVLVRNGEPHALQADELATLNALNREHEVIDTYQEMILQQYGAFTGENGVPLEPMTTTMVAESLGYKQPTNQTARAVGVALGKCGYHRESIRLSGKPTKGYLMPPKLQT